MSIHEAVKIKIYSQGFASSDTRMSCPRATKDDIMLAVEEIGCER